MDKVNSVSSENTKSKEKKSSKTGNDNQEQYRVVITKEANECLEEIATKVNRGFEGGEVNRSDVAVYVFQNLSKLLSDSDLKAIRARHFDEKKVLGSILRSENELPEEIRRALREYYGVSEKDKKRTLRVTSELSTDQSGDNSSAA